MMFVLSVSQSTHLECKLVRRCVLNHQNVFLHAHVRRFTATQRQVSKMKRILAINVLRSKYKTVGSKISSVTVLMLAVLFLCCFFFFLLSGSIASSSFDDQVTFIVKTHERPQCLRKLLQSLRLVFPTTSVLVADDGQVSLRMQPDPHTHVVTLPYDVGLSAARNALVERVQTPFFVTLDDDFVFSERTSIARLLAVLEARPELDIVAGSLYLPGQESQPYAYAELLDVVDDGRELRMRKGSHGPVPGFEGDCERYDIALNFFVARTARIRAMGGWDARLKLGEHQDFFLRAKRAGLGVAVCPSLATALHEQDHSDANYKRKRMREFQFLRQMLESHGLRRLRLSTGPIYVNLD
jgi:GT2 family glycosyltransferase